jgi:hypothetical protein
MLGSRALKGSSLRPADVARFWSKVNVTQYGCWEWKGSKQRKGYGTFRLLGRTELAHRVAWALFNIEAQANLSICHDCDNPSCCRPNHMFEGTNADNVADSIAKQRPRGPAPGTDSTPPEKRARGSRHPATSLSDEDVKQLRRDAKGGTLRRELANRYGISMSTVSNITSRRTWSHI